MSSSSRGSLTAFAVAVIAMTLLAPGDAAAERVLKVEAFDAGAYYFRVDGLPGRNPTITLRPGEMVRVEVQNVASENHNIHFGDPINQATGLLAPAENDVLTFTVGDDFEGETRYWCDPHRTPAFGMAGTVVVTAEDADPARAMGVLALLVVAAVAVAVGVTRFRRR